MDPFYQGFGAACFAIVTFRAATAITVSFIREMRRHAAPFAAAAPPKPRGERCPCCGGTGALESYGTATNGSRPC